MLESFVKLFFSSCIFLRHDAIEISISATAAVTEIYSGLRGFNDFARTIVYENLEAAPEALTITCPSRLALHPPPATLHSTRCTGATLRLTRSV